jgi:hypothetical protein
VQLVQLSDMCQTVMTKADSVKIRFQETTSEGREDFIYVIVTGIFVVYNSVR